MNRLLQTLFILLIASSVSLTSFAQKKDGRRDQWEKEMRQAKIEFMQAELKITPDQKNKFVETYNAMMDEMKKLRKETHSMRKGVESKKNASDLELEKAAEAMFEFKEREGKIENLYFNKFKTFLTPQQLFQFKIAESKWMKSLIKHRKKNK